MATLSSASCFSYATQLPSSSSPTSVSQAPICGHNQRIALPSDPQRFHSAKISCQSNRRSSNRNAVRMQDGDAAPAITPVENENPFKKLKDNLPPTSPPEETKVPAQFDFNQNESTVTITVVGASGDLAKKKIFPALFALYYEDCLPEHFTVFGYARTKMADAELRTMISKTLTCRIDKRENCGEKMDQFLERCFYHSGQYDSLENFAELDRKMKGHEGGRVSNRLFYLSIPPNIFMEAVKCASLSASSGNGWTRVIVEKPFGRDSKSSAALTRALKQYLQEDQIFRFASSKTSTWK
ncbi:hypothetical protein SAY87_001747 [Trapa incisa]|uniref:Glucose-6-phosphate dehydrogenase NAD-binding domain-containing protein n=1 Tax=Trapa incisa TaxID=236973 RepID=A0AAN7JT42_9MYRT|nr:hypothetical protein SAY87_001747 [Trapa incisa]